VPPTASDNRWLVLVHQLPAKPSFARVRVWRRLQALGAVALKNAVYVLPNRDSTREDFEWLAREVAELGGSATVCEARLVQGFDDREIEELFQAAREADYQALLKDAQELDAGLRTARSRRQAAASLATDVAALRRRLVAAGALDFFGAANRVPAEALIAELEGRLGLASAAAEAPYRLEDLRGRTWVTRTGVHVDRIACAWLIRRFIDRDAAIKFVPAKGYRPEPGELRFDMFEAEFTHEGDRCTFETLCARLGLEDPALRAVGEIVHDIDLKEEKFGRPETAGVARLLAGLARRTRDDRERIERGGQLFDDLYESFPRRGGSQK
jgi:hypothetical protein